MRVGLFHPRDCHVEVIKMERVGAVGAEQTGNNERVLR